MKRNLYQVLILCFAVASGSALADRSGLNPDAMDELRAAGVDKYLGTSESQMSEHGVWTRHDFDPKYVLDPTYPSGLRPDGPACIAGTPYSVFTRQGDPKKLLIFMQGGGACWQGFYNCNVLATTQAGARGQEPPEDGPFPGVFDPTMSSTRSRTTRLSTCRTVTARRSAATTM
jgi:hypothetical protein